MAAEITNNEYELKLSTHELAEVQCYETLHLDGGNVASNNVDVIMNCTAIKSNSSNNSCRNDDITAVCPPSTFYSNNCFEFVEQHVVLNDDQATAKKSDDCHETSDDNAYNIVPVESRDIQVSAAAVYAAFGTYGQD